jgi:hypothetical protein
MKIIQKLKSGLGYTWAVLCLVLVLATFIGLGFWEHMLTKETGIRVSPRFSGGEVRQTIDHGFYRTVLHRLVFDGLVGERAEGFVQIDWVPQEKRSLPTTLEEDFDIDGDASTDITVRLDTAAGRAQLLRKAAWVLGPEPLIAADSERILRVRLRNPHSSGR